MSLTYKLLRPSREHLASDMGGALSEAEQMMRRGTTGSMS
jgi:hypothetical protein